MSKHRFSSVVLVVFAFAAGFVYAQQRGEPALAADDYAAIQRLLWTNHQGFDFATDDNADLWTSTFVPDAEIHNSGRVVAGGEAIREFALDYFKTDPRRKIRHWTSTFHITPSAEGATLAAFWFIMTQSGGEDGLRIGSGGRYESTVVRTPTGWRIKKHVVLPEGPVTADQVG